jgi:hypothetical protein
MIVYSGKQFWNNFNNGDDAVFGDSNRPRDENGFKLRPWLQGDKWSFRDVNKKTWFSQIVLKWWSDIATTPSWQPTNREIPIVKAKRKASDWKEVWYPFTIDDGSWKSWTYSNEIWNNPQYKIVEWNFQYEYNQAYQLSWQPVVPAVVKTKQTASLEIVEDGLYNVSCYWWFYFDYKWSFNSNNAYLYKERIGLMECAEDTDNRFKAWPWTCQRAVWNGDPVYYNGIHFFTKWLKILPYAALQQPNWLNGVYFCMSVTKLW